MIYVGTKEYRTNQLNTVSWKILRLFQCLARPSWILNEASSRPRRLFGYVKILNLFIPKF